MTIWQRAWQQTGRPGFGAVAKILYLIPDQQLVDKERETGSDVAFGNLKAQTQ